MSRRTTQALILSAAAFILSTAMAWGVLGAMPQLEDEHANFYQAQVFASGRVTADVPRAFPEAFYIPFIVQQNGQMFGKYTPGYPLLLAAGTLIGVPWAVNALAAAVCVFAVYLLGRDLFDADVGVLGAALTATSPLVFMLSGTLLAHTTTMAQVVLFAWAFLRARRPGDPRRTWFAVIAGSTIGWALITRPYTAFVIGAGCALIALRDVFDHPRVHWRTYALMLAVASGVVAILPVYNWLATGSPTTSTYTLYWPYDSVGFGPAHGRGPDGHTWEIARLNFSIDISDLGRSFLGWPSVLGVSLSIVPLLLGLWWPPHNKRDWALLVPPLVLIVAHLAYWARGSSLYGPRYYAEGVPFLGLLAARGLLKFSAGTWRRRLTMAALPLLLAYSVVFTIEPRLLDAYALYGRLRLPVDQIDAARLGNALVFVRAASWSDYASLAWQNKPLLQASPVLYAIDYGSAANELIRQAYPGRRVFYYDRTQGIPLVAGR